MPRLIFKCPYIRGGSKKVAAHLNNYVRYMATREGAQRIAADKAQLPATKKQQQMVEQLLRDFPLSRGTFEYEDYAAAPTQGNAADFITRALEDNYDAAAKKENYISYPQPERGEAERADFDAAATMPPTAEPRPVIPLILTADNPADKMKEITDRLEQGIMGVFESERYAEYLRTMSKFHNYSLNNTLLIAMQGGNLVKGYRQWEKEFDRHVKPGEKAIKILAPAPYKVKKEREKIDPDTKMPVIGADGKPVMETQEITIPAYKVVSVFDVSQTEGRELPDLSVSELTGDVEQYRDFFAALERTSPFAIAFETLDGGAKGRCYYEENRIAIHEGMSELQNIKTAIHEISHATMHDTAPDDPTRPDRRTREVQAESVAYAVCQHYGLDTSDYSFGYVAGWSSGKELSELKGSLETIRSTAAKLIETIDGHFAEIQQEKAAVQEQEAQPITPEPQPAQEKPEQATPQEAAPQEAEPSAVKYYPINEAAARRAKEMNSYSDYKPGSATAEYRSYVEKAPPPDTSVYGRVEAILDAVPPGASEQARVYAHDLTMALLMDYIRRRLELPASTE